MSMIFFLQYRGVVSWFDACSVLLVLYCTKCMKPKLKCDYSVFIVKLKPNAKSEIRRLTGRTQFKFPFATLAAAVSDSAPSSWLFPRATQGNLVSFDSFLWGILHLWRDCSFSFPVPPCCFLSVLLLGNFVVNLSHMEPFTCLFAHVYPVDWYSFH